MEDEWGMSNILALAIHPHSSSIHPLKDEWVKSRREIHVYKTEEVAVLGKCIDYFSDLVYGHWLGQKGLKIDSMEW